MKNNRSASISEEVTQKHSLSDASPDPSSLFWRLWEHGADIAQRALQTPFMQGIGAGNLDPVVYGAFNVGDCYYCYHGAPDYQEAANRAKNPVLQDYLMSKYKSYQAYNATLPQTWRVQDGSSIVPMDITKEYSSFETSIARHEDAVYTLIAMLPCEYLWPWLAAQLAPPAEGNLYAKWITDNNDPSGAYKMGNFLEQYCKENPIDENKAMDIYAKAMTYEWQNFAAAMPEPATADS